MSNEQNSEQMNVLTDMDLPRVMDRETGEEVALFKSKQQEQQKPVFSEMVSVVLSKELTDYLLKNNVTTLFLDNLEHIELLCQFVNLDRPVRKETPESERPVENIKKEEPVICEERRREEETKLATDKKQKQTDTKKVRKNR